MKKIFGFGLIALFLGLTSCDDAYNIIQESELSEEAAYRSVADLQTGLNGVYGAYNPDANIIVFNDLFTDNLRAGTSNNGRGSETYSWVINSQNGTAGSIWSSRLGAINFANRVLRNVDRIMAISSPAEQAAAQDIRAQLYALRAMCHFDIYQYFTPDLEDDNSPSAIKLDFVPNLLDVFPRNSAKEILDFVLSDIEAAEALINPSASISLNGQRASNIYITRDALSFLKVRVLQFRNDASDYAEIITLANTILANHEVISRDDYADFWADNAMDNPENIWTLVRRIGDIQIASAFYDNGTEITGNPIYEMSHQLYDLYAPGDIRKEVFVDVTSRTEFNNPGIDPADREILIDKYPGSSNGRLYNHYKIYRASEMLLIRAEIEAKQDNYTACAASLKELRDKRLLTPAPLDNFTTRPQALRAVLEERRKELCYEGHRYLDLKRVGPEAGVNINRAASDCSSFVAPCDLPSTDYRFTLPIPRVEINANPSIQQNPNY